MSFSLYDGLGGEQVQIGSRAGQPTQSPYFTGSLTVNGATTLTGGVTASAGLSVTGSIVVSSNGFYSAGSPYNVGWITIPMTARAIISGGMWVTGSVNLAMPSAASVKNPIGVAAATAASGATVNVIIRGIVPMVADGTVVAANGCMPGAGAALNTVAPHVAGSSTQYSVLSNAGSEGVVFVVL